MPNPYEHLFGADPGAPLPHSQPLPLANVPPEPPPPYLENQPEALDEILQNIRQFDEKAKHFCILLSQTRAVDDAVENHLLRLFVALEDPHDQRSLAGEKTYHHALCRKFRNIAAPMKELALLHLDTLRRFNNDVDDAYFSVEKEQAQINDEKQAAQGGLQIQRKILADAATTLQTLEDALGACEDRMKNYVDAGGTNNLSASELALMRRSRQELTSGRDYQFNHTFFKMNLLDQAALALGFFQKETTAQYLQKLLHVLENRND